MTTGMIIPRTTIQTYYKRVSGMSYAKRVAEVESLLSDPTPLVATFDQSVATFSFYDNPKEGFYSNRKRAPKQPAKSGEIGKTSDVAWHLRQQNELPVVGASELDAVYVDYEIAPARTTDHAVFSDRGTWRSGVFVDLLLANRADCTPIVGELKIRRDKDPFTALVQVLACAAHLATPSQIKRLKEHLPLGHALRSDPPVVDGCLLLFRFLETPQPHLQQLDERAEQLAAALMKYPQISDRLRRLACIDLELVGGAFTGTKRWSHEP